MDAKTFMLAMCVLVMLAVAGSWRAAQPLQHESIRPQATGFRINVNRESADMLTLLPGVGPEMARRIVAHRDAQGSFTSVTALDNVHGIGPRSIERVRAFVALDP